MSPDGKVRVVVRSRKVPARSFSWQVSSYTIHGIFEESQTRHGVTYERELEPPHLRAVEEAKRLSDSTGLELEVVDLGKQNFLQRLVGGVIDRDGVSSLPEIRLQVPNPTGVSSQLEPLVRSLA